MITIAVIGRAQQHAGDIVPEATLAAAYEVGRLVAIGGAALVSGGTTGVMEAASRGARVEGGLTIGVLPGFERDSANAFVDIALPTGLGTARNLIYTRGCDAVIMVGGGAGTLNELTIAYQAGRTVIVVEGTGGWADRIRAGLVDGRFLDERRTVAIRFAGSPAAAVEEALAAARTLAAEDRRPRPEAGWDR
ncbi:MAG TPA: TIGR00725 family protein [Patescibacteria group bacterium]|nr:TIGR00725 family protein [Patescibacteria group bacterium]